MHILVIRFDTPLTGGERVEIREGSVERFRALDGLEEKYYLGDLERPAAGGAYLFDSREQADAYLGGPIVAGIQDRYQAEQPPSVQRLDVHGRFDAPTQLPASGHRVQLGSVLSAGARDVHEPAPEAMAACVEIASLQRLFWVSEQQTGRQGVLGVWADADDLGALLRSDTLVAISGVPSEGADYQVDEVARVLREEP